MQLTDNSSEAHRPGALLSAAGLGRRLGHAWIWRGVGFRLEPGRSLAIVGPTGTGKTLLLRCLAALDPLDEGVVELDGRPPEQWGLPAYRSRVVYVQQRPALWEGSVEENLEAIFRLAVHRSRRYDRSRAVDWLEAFGRGPGFLDKTSAELSGGEAQIVALVRALCAEPRVLLLDEPSASMDARATTQAEELVRRWLAEGSRRACIWTSHDARQVERVADRTLRLGPPEHEKEPAREGTREGVKESDEEDDKEGMATT